MGWIATLVTRCPKCGEFYEKEKVRCSVCDLNLEVVGVVNADELRRLIERMSSQENIVRLLNAFNKYMGG